ncbi:alpha-D-ribose 1-methylphosphonate 5-triphosphate synthase subunit PhnG [Bosea lupini]|jgi:alpha-D-ribose 1-methylphosphonate 5-triphosphate synthase subunit PhnG|uniref:Alpha-D-ribose 1-methylphosphonate 5-triphosphate synthase subunit PhnG n=1 Tax=Bosea lupini TaxID=1036779 RepID=A0A1H7NC00_9HYPH|nr:phosphonate C-P lyase system protein PhnG [Bosea lupini]SEL21132.1 alpha-D-ribose 1-methylphosphonate 5-triphosphate synthase subunit PhnG [Bosea lupini]
MTDIATRQHWMAVLARATQGEIDALLQQTGPLPTHELLKAPQTGTVMVEGRAGGAGRRFNLGEATVTRCVVRLEGGAMGFSYALGRDGRKARLAAVTDALLQGEAETGPLRRGVFALAQKQQAARELASRKAAATKVDFFTLVRGG